MPVFPSREWMVDLCEHVVAHPRAPELARALDGTYAFVVEPAGPVRVAHRYDLAVHPGEAERVRAAVLDRPGDAPRITFTARFDRWWQLLHGELDPRLAIVLRRLRVAGDVQGLARHLSTVAPLLEALGRVETRWPA